MAYGASSAAAAQAAMVQAVKASGAIIRVEPDVFISIISKADKPLVVTSIGGIIKKEFRYLSPYKGLIFYTRNTDIIDLPGNAETISAKEIWIPS